MLHVIRLSKCGELRSVAEEQPQQNDHRYRHAYQPEQKSFSHVSLHFHYAWRTPKGTSGSSGSQEKRLTNVRYSALSSTAPPAAWHRPSATARSNAGRASA